jgi:hypothetical protein
LVPPEEIPAYPAFRKITLSDMGQVEGLFRRYPAEVSERTFGSIFTWRNYSTRSRLSMFDGHLLISWRREQFGDLLLPPAGEDPTGTIAGLVAERPAGFNGFFCLTEPSVSALRKDGLDPEPLRDEWDYVYRTADLISLDGPKYHTQRKEIKKATSQYDLVFEPMSAERKQASLQLEESWCDLRSCSFDTLSAAEDAALREALVNYESLGLLGGVVLIDGKVEALTIGERLNANTAVVHFEKANPDIRGLYPFIGQQFCANMLKDFEFVNREQDLGEPGLRRAKTGYHPHHFVEKHVLRFT